MEGKHADQVTIGVTNMRTTDLQDRLTRFRLALAAAARWDARLHAERVAARAAAAKREKGLTK